MRRIAASVGTVGLGITVALAPGGPASASGAAAAAGHPNSWGTGNLGQLGNGSTANHFTPTTVNIVASQISAGREHGLAVSGGAAYAWGWNNYGQLGDGTTSNRATPGKVAGACAGSKVAEVAAGHYSSLARCADGTAWGWGRDDTGQLGDAGTRAVTHPQRIPGLTGVIQIAGGRNHSIALRSSGTVSLRLTPVATTGLIGVTAVAGGRDHSLACASGGAVYAWGKNTYGQLGDGTTTNRRTPTRVVGVSATSVSGGKDFSLAL